MLEPEPDGVDVNGKGRNGCTALIVAAESGHSEMLAMLVKEFKADLELKDNVYGWTALMFAAFLAKSGAVRTLLRLGANVNQRNDKGNTALSLAHEGPFLLTEQSAKKLTIQMLLQKGAIH